MRMKSHASRTWKLTALLGLVCLLTVGLVACRSSQRNAAPPPVEPPKPAATAAAKQSAGADAQVVTDRRKGFFDHARQEHRIQPAGPIESCEVCHQRSKENPTDAKLTQPGRRTPTWLPFHDACTQCHAAEAFQQTDPATLEKSPLCAACHRGGITDNNRALLADYPVRTSEFGLQGIGGNLKGFAHRTHSDPQKMGADADKAKCATCHNFDQAGVRGSFPRHPECFSCHAHQAEQKWGACGVCHIFTAQAVSFVRGPEQAFQLFRFRHSPAHLKAATCDKCHRLQEPASASRLDILKISTGQGQRHTSACWTCHKQAQEPVCTKCHTSPPPILRAGL